MDLVTRCLYSQSAEADGTIKPELLMMELQNGKVSEDDYLAQSFKLLDDVIVDVPPYSSTNRDRAVTLNTLNDVLVADYDGFDHGYVRMQDGTWYLSAKVDLRFCTGEMFEWWFNHCDNSERYRWWHPKTHLEGEFDPPFYAVQPIDRLPGHYINHTHIFKLKMEGVKTKLRVEYLHPMDFVDNGRFNAAGVSVCIVGKIHLHDPDLGDIKVGHVCHLVTERSGRATVTTRMWVGDIESKGSVFPPTAYINGFCNSFVYRMYKWPEHFARSMWINLVEEMSCLAEFLPKFYRAERKRLAEASAEDAAVQEVGQEVEYPGDGQSLAAKRKGRELTIRTTEEVRLGDEMSYDSRDAPAAGRDDIGPEDVEVEEKSDEGDEKSSGDDDTDHGGDRDSAEDSNTRGGSSQMKSSAAADEEKTTSRDEEKSSVATSTQIVRSQTSSRKIGRGVAI